MSLIVGSRYEETRGETTTQIAARFRADVKAAIVAGDVPKGTKMSIRTDYFSMGSAIRAKIVALPDGTSAGAAQTIREKLDAMLQAYNRDDSDIMSDYFSVRFWGKVEIAYQIKEALR